MPTVLSKPVFGEPLPAVVTAVVTALVALVASVAAAVVST